jgi:hypothetical protein
MEGSAMDFWLQAEREIDAAESPPAAPQQPDGHK